MSDEENQDKSSTRSTLSYLEQAGNIRKDGYIVSHDFPCKVIKATTSTSGKHGHSKCHIVGIDIFTGKRYEEIIPSTQNVEVPVVTRTDYTFTGISENDIVSLRAENGDTKEDLRLPTDDKLSDLMKSGLGEGKKVVVTVLSSLGIEGIRDVKVVDGDE